MKLFEVENLTKKYGERVVLNIPSLALQSDKIYSILGPNGSGKSTLMRLLNLLETPDSGSIKYRGILTNGGEAGKLAIQREMAMVFQKPYMFRTTVYNNVAYGLKLRGVSKSQIKRQVIEVLEYVNMMEFINKQAYKLSGGEAQRVALARALVIKPKVLLLDEPTANLDPFSVQAVEDIVRGSCDKFGTTVVMVTHNLFQAKRIADETILLFGGEVIEHQATAKFFSNARDPRTRGFIDGSLVY